MKSNVFMILAAIVVLVVTFWSMGMRYSNEGEVSTVAMPTVQTKQGYIYDVATGDETEVGYYAIGTTDGDVIFAPYKFFDLAVDTSVILTMDDTGIRSIVKSNTDYLDACNQASADDTRAEHDVYDYAGVCG